MKLQRLLSSMSIAATLALGLAPAVHATPIAINQSVRYDLNIVDSAGTKSALSYATIFLTQGDGLVDISVTPVNGSLFANTGGPHFEFAFNLSSAFNGAVVSMKGANASDFIVMGGSSFTQAPFGAFGHAIDFTSSIGNGTSAKYNSPLTFSVAMKNLNIENFINNADGFRFAADLSTASGVTQNIASSTGDSIVSAGGTVPEPASFALVGLGLLAFGVIRRKTSAK